MRNIVIYIAIMAIVTYLIRMLPIMVFRKKIKSRFFKSFLFYVPYAVLGAMTFPAIFYSTGDTVSAVCGAVAALLTALKTKQLTIVAAAAAIAALIAKLICECCAA